MSVLKIMLVSFVFARPLTGNAETLLARCLSGGRTLDVYGGQSSPEAVVVVRGAGQTPTLVDATLVPSGPGLGSSFAYGLRFAPIWGIAAVDAGQCAGVGAARGRAELESARDVGVGQVIDTEMCLYFVSESDLNVPIAQLLATHAALTFMAQVECVMNDPGTVSQAPCAEIRIPGTKFPVDPAAPACSVI